MAKKTNASSKSITINSIHPKDMTTKHWIDDFESLYQMIKDNYPYLWVKERTHGYNWLDLKSKYLARIWDATKITEFLDIFFDAVTALQNRHTLLCTFDQISWRLQSNSTHQKNEPYKSIFTAYVKEAYDFWKPILDNHLLTRSLLNYEVTFAYSKGEYLIIDGLDSWQDKFGVNSKIIAVNEIPIDEAIKSVYNTCYIDWDTKRHKNYI